MANFRTSERMQPLGWSATQRITFQYCYYGKEKSNEESEESEETGKEAPQIVFEILPA